MHKQIIVRDLVKPVQKNVTEDIEWVCDSLGFARGRDLTHLSTRLVAALLERLSNERGIPTELLAEELDVSSARVNHHIRNLMESGILFREHRLVMLRGGSLKSAIEELRKDANRIFDELTIIAQDIDATMGLKNR